MTQTSSGVSYDAETAQIVCDVFGAMLAMDLEHCGTGPAPAGPDGVLSAGVYFTGPWRGAALVECTPGQAREFARRLMPVDVALSADDVRDALGEIANMVGGNLKAILPAGVGISMPSVVAGSDFTLRVCGGRILTRVNLDSAVGVFRVIVVETAAGS